ncbi:MAG: peptidase family protein [Gemmatimonadetes bacterium]|nr:peptidase family protein [Gemmatimonadota bacterium]
MLVPLALAAGAGLSPAHAQQAPAGPPAAVAPSTAPSGDDARIHEIVRAASAARVERDVRTLAGFGTRHTMSDTMSATRGIGAARRWLFAELTRISQQCGGCLQVMYVDSLVRGDTASRITRDTRVVDVVAIQRGIVDANRFVVVQGHYDSRVSEANNATSDAPGANDDASGVAAALESARLLSRYRFNGSIVYAALAGEEQGLHGGETLARYARAHGWRVEGVLNNDIVGNTRGQGGLVNNTTARIFGPGIPTTATAAELRRYLYSGGELDTPSRELARYVVGTADRFVPNLDLHLVYRLDRFGRGGDHTPWFTQGFPAVRLTESQEDYTRQHQDLRTENGIRYGDTPDMVDYPYLAKMASLNAASLASLAWAPPSPDSVYVSGAVTPNTVLRWKPVTAPNLAGYHVYWRLPSSATWQKSRWVGNATTATLENINIDDYFFAVAAVDTEGHESVPVFPVPAPRR